MTSLAKYFDEVGVMIWRDLVQIPRMPERLGDVTIQPIMFVVLFGYVFGSAIVVPGGGSYNEFLVAGIMVQTLAFGAMGTAIGVLSDMHETIMDRFRSLPIARSTVLVGRAVGSLIQSLLGITIMAMCGLAIGWTVHNGFLDTLAGFGLLIFFAFAMICVGSLIGLLVRTAGSAQGIAFVTVLPLSFISIAFVPIDNMPTVLRTIAEWSPVSALVEATRQLFGNPSPVPDGAAWPLLHPVVGSLIWCTALTATSLGLAVHRYTRRSNG